jgi:hypothetical protein
LPVQERNKVRKEIESSWERKLLGGEEIIGGGEESIGGGRGNYWGVGEEIYFGGGRKLNYWGGEETIGGELRGTRFRRPCN